MKKFFERYAPALRAYAKALRPSLCPDDLEDLVQGFVADKVLTGSLLAQPPRGGKFRPLLKTALRNYVVDFARRQSPVLRTQRLVSDVVEHGESGDAAFDRAWTRSLIQQAMEATRAEALDESRGLEWSLFEARVLRPVLEGAPSPPLRDFLPEAPGSTVASLSNLVVTGKRRFRRHLERFVAEYCLEGDTIEDEIAALRISGG